MILEELIILKSLFLVMSSIQFPTSVFLHVLRASVVFVISSHKTHEILNNILTYLSYYR